MRRDFIYVVLCFFIVSSASILNAQWVGIDGRVANSFAVAQGHSEWCWAASSQLVLTLNGVSTTQTAIVQRVHGNLQNIPGSDADLTSALTTTRTTAMEHAGFPSSGVLLQELSAERPVVIEFMTGPNSGHVVVITSVYVTQSPAGSLITSIVLRDPWPSPVNVVNSGRVQIDNFNIVQFAKTVRAHWIVSVTDDGTEGSATEGSTVDPPVGIMNHNVQPTDDNIVHTIFGDHSCQSDYKECVGNISSHADCMESAKFLCMGICKKTYPDPDDPHCKNFCNADAINDSADCKKTASEDLKNCKDALEECKKN
jgi:hypothetical protein